PAPHPPRPPPIEAASTQTGSSGTRSAGAAPRTRPHPPRRSGRRSPGRWRSMPHSRTYGQSRARLLRRRRARSPIPPGEAPAGCGSRANRSSAVAAPGPGSTHQRAATAGVPAGPTAPPPPVAELTPVCWKTHCAAGTLHGRLIGAGPPRPSLGRELRDADVPAGVKILPAHFPHQLRRQAAHHIVAVVDQASERTIELIISHDQIEPELVVLQRQLELPGELLAEIADFLPGRTGLPQPFDLLEHRAPHLLGAVGSRVVRDVDRVPGLGHGAQLGADVDG